MTTRRSDARLPIAVAIASVAISAAPRVMLAAGNLPAAARPFIWSDALLLYNERLRSGAIPYLDTFFEYPPLIGYASGLLVRLVHDPVAFVAAWSVLCAIAAGIVAYVLTREAGARAALLWSLSPQLLLYSAINFDVLALACLVTAIALSRVDRPWAVMAALAVGTVTKAFPALAVPVEAQRLGSARGPFPALRGLTVFGILTLLIALPAVIAPHGLLTSAAYLGSLTNFDSVWGFVLAALEGLGVTGASTIVVTGSAVGTIATYVWALRRARGELARGAALGTIAVLLWSRLYSPQYSLWVVPFFALGVLPMRAFALLSIADIAVFATVYPLTLVAWTAGDSAPTILFAALAVGVVLRHVALIAALMGSRSSTSIRASARA